MRRRIKPQQKLIYATSLFIFCVSQFVYASEDPDHELLKHKEFQPYFELRDMSQKKAIEDAPIACPSEVQAPRILEENSIHHYQNFFMFDFDSDSGENDSFESDNSSRSESEHYNEDNKTVPEELNNSSKPTSKSEKATFDDSKKSERRSAEVKESLSVTDHYDLTGEKVCKKKDVPSGKLDSQQ